MTARDRARAAGKRWAVRVGALPPDHRYTEGDMPDAIADEFAADVKLADKWREVAARFSAKLIFALDDPASLMGQRIVLASEKADDSRLAELAREFAKAFDGTGPCGNEQIALLTEARRQLAAAAPKPETRCSCGARTVGELGRDGLDVHGLNVCTTDIYRPCASPIASGSRLPRKP